MPVSIPYIFSNGTVAEAAEVNSNFTAVKNFSDGLASGVNLEDGAVVAAKIGTGAVTSAKLASGILPTADDNDFILSGQVFG